jgi:glycosyltransferase involved in cell wall biosynthesis
MPSVHQLIIGSSRRDAITNMALNLRDALAKTYDAEVYSYFAPDHTIDGEVRHVPDMPLGTTEDILVYHSSFGIEDVTQQLLQRPERLVIVYHNITPSKYYEDTDPVFAEQLAWGRRELELIRDKVVMSFADSEYNAEDLAMYGYADISVVPAGVNPRRLDEVPTSTYFLGELTQHFPNGFVLFVSQVLQHKRAELALEMVHLLRSVWQLDVGLVIAGPNRKPMYRRDLEKLRQRLPEAHVLFTDEITEQQLATLYRSCLVYVGTSEHEGLAIPPLEAMANGAPVVVRAAGAVAETVKQAGIIVPLESGIGELTGAVARVIEDNSLRHELVKSGYERVSEFESVDTTSHFVERIGKLFI